MKYITKTAKAVKIFFESIDGNLLEEMDGFQVWAFKDCPELVYIQVAR